MARDRPTGDALTAALEGLLTRVERPTRYIGGEWNSIVKSPGSVETTVALAFPDVYEIGMSHLGYRILYSLLNALPSVAAERIFMPWADMFDLLEEQGLPLASLETRRPLSEFDLVGFSMQYELTITNVLAMLDRGRIPLLAAERGEEDPLVLGGGPVLVNPEPFADFFDLILIGDAEQALPEMIATCSRLRRQGKSRKELLRAVAGIEGWYAPSLYDVEPEPLLGMLIPRPKEGEPVPLRVKRRVVYDLTPFPFPEKIVVPHGEIVHDRVSFELQRGCPVGCRFCQAGYIYRPTRERDPETILEGVRRSVAATGYDEFSLTSLNTGEYGAIEALLTRLMDEMEPRSVSVGLSSLHASTMTENLAEQVKRVGKTGFTIAPEAGSQRLRDVINKNLTEEQILEATRLAFDAGWVSVKLYFMIGLPTETTEDVEAQVDLARRILAQGRAAGGGRVKLTHSASTFIPKPFTPFQWFGMQPEQEFLAKQTLIRRSLPRGVEFRHHNHGESWLEGVLSRADRSVAPAILEAYRRGAKLDGWSEHFKLDLWREVFDDLGIPADELATREIPLEAELPWEVIDPLIRRNWLEREYQRALEVQTVVPCNDKACTACAPFAKECIKGVVQQQRWSDLPVSAAPAGRTPEAESPPAAPGGAGDATLAGGAPAVDKPGETSPEPLPRPVYRYRLRFEKLGRARFLGHLDLVRALLQGLRRAEVQFVYSKGFKPRPKIALGPALGLGISSREEYLDIETHRPLDDPRMLEHLNRHLAEGLRLTALAPREIHARALQDEIACARYRVRVEGAGQEELAALLEAFEKREIVEVLRRRKGKEKRIDIRPRVAHLSLAGEGAFDFDILFGEGSVPKPVEVVAAILGQERAQTVQLERLGLFSRAFGRMVSPLVAGQVSLARGA